MLKQVVLILTTVIQKVKHLTLVCTFCLYSCLCSFVVAVVVVVVEFSSSVIILSLRLSKSGKE